MTDQTQEDAARRLGDLLLEAFSRKDESGRSGGFQSYPTHAQIISCVKSLGGLGNPAGLPFLFHVQENYYGSGFDGYGKAIDGLDESLSEAISAIGHPDIIPYYVDKYLAQYARGAYCGGPGVHAERELIGALSKIENHKEVTYDWPLSHNFFVKKRVELFRASICEPENFDLATEVAIRLVMNQLNQRADVYGNPSSSIFSLQPNYLKELRLVNARFFIPRGVDIFAKYKTDIDDIKRTAQEKKNAVYNGLSNYPGGNYLKNQIK